MDDNYISFKTSSPAGDGISFMAGLKQMTKETGKPCRLYQRLNMPGVAYAESIHPYQNSQGEPVAMPRSIFDMLIPLLKSQNYIEDYLVYSGEEVDYDLDLIRLERYTGQPNTSLNRWYSYVFPQMACDLSKKYIELPEGEKSGKIILNYTQRFRNHIIDYHFLINYEDKLIFAGLKSERDMFCEQWGLDIPLLEVKDFLELATIINNCLFFAGNASMCFQIAEALKVPRVLEVFPRMPNVIPTGELAFDYYGQHHAEHFFNKLNNQ